MAKGFDKDIANIHAANAAELKNRLKTGSVSGAYLFYGDEEYLKQHYSDELVKFCGDRKLNVRTFYDDDFSLTDFSDACRTNASMAVSMFDTADSANDTVCRMIRLMSVSFSGLSKSDEKYFLSQIEDPDDGVIILFYLYPGEEDKLKSDLYKKITKSVLPVLFRHETYGSNMLLSWILRHFSKAGIKADRHVISYFNNYVGNDMTTLKNEIDNCIDYLRFQNRDTLTVEDVEFICKKSLNAQIFDISSKALDGDIAGAMAAYKIFRKSGEKELLIYGTLSKAVYDMCTVDRLAASGMPAAEIVKKTGMRDFVVRKTLNTVAKRNRETEGSYPAYAAEVTLEYDSFLKSGRIDGYDLLEELIFKLASGNRKEE